MTLSSLFLLSGCATAPASSGPRMSSRARIQQRTLHTNVARTDALVRGLRSLSDAELTADEGRDSVIALARAQTCVALYAGAPNIAAQTVELLDHYEQLHVETHGRDERWGRRRIRVARRDAEIASQDAPVLQLRCNDNWPSRRGFATRGDNVRQAWGIETPVSRGYNRGSIQMTGTVH